MKTVLTLEFDGEKDKINRIVNADSAYSALWEIRSFLRDEMKYATELKTLDQLAEEINEIIDNSVDLERDFS